MIRPHPQLVEFLEQVGDDDGFLDELATLEGGAEARDAIEAYLERYGMRCTGEVDITRPRWSERPATLVPLILGNVKSIEPGAGKRRFERGRAEAREQEQELLERLRTLPDGSRRPARRSAESTSCEHSWGTASIRSTAWSAATSSTSRRCCGGRAPGSCRRAP